jgi:hypothetical protein
MQVNSTGCFIFAVINILFHTVDVDKYFFRNAACQRPSVASKKVQVFGTVPAAHPRNKEKQVKQQV